MSHRFSNLIRGGETAEVAAAVEADPSLITSRDAQGVSAFLWSIYSGQPLIRDFLLARLTDLDPFEAAALGDCDRLESMLQRDTQWLHQVSLEGWTPLHLAAGFGGAAATALLLRHGAQVNRVSRNPMHNQPLHACISLSKDCATARILIDHGAEVNTAAAGGYTPLHQSAAAGLVEMTQLLLAAGAHTENRCDRGKTPLDYARERAHYAVVQVLEDRSTPDAG